MVSVKEGSLSAQINIQKICIYKWVKDYRNWVKDEECSSTTQGFVRDVIFL